MYSVSIPSQKWRYANALESGFALWLLTATCTIIVSASIGIGFSFAHCFQPLSKSKSTIPKREPNAVPTRRPVHFLFFVLGLPHVVTLIELRPGPHVIRGLPHVVDHSRRRLRGRSSGLPSTSASSRSGLCTGKSATKHTHWHATCRRKQQTLGIRNRRNRRHVADFWLGSVSSTVPE